MRYYIIIILLLVSFSASSQNEANIWYFGDKAGLDFNSGVPVPLTNSAMSQNEGVATISDADGNLLFYTNGITVWDKSHSIMSNGTGLLGGISSTQSGIIVPKPGSETLYYIFTVPSEIGYDGLNYSEVDLNQNGGLGAVTTKNQFLVQPTEEKITGVIHANGTDIWVLTHLWNSSEFYAYMVSSDGVNTTPTISDVGSVHSGEEGMTHGMIKASPDGTKIAITVREESIVELFDFNNAAGVVSNPLQLPGDYEHAYGLEFSHDGSKLYVGKYFDGSFIYQYDLKAGTPAGIVDSRVQIGSVSNSHLGALQLAPDKKIYVSKNDNLVGDEYLGVIHNPTASGMDCDFEEDGLYLNGRLCIWGLPNFIQSIFREAQDFTFTNTCEQDSTYFSITNTNNINSVYWDFGDPGSGQQNNSTELNPSHFYAETGTYEVTLITEFPLYTDTLIHTIIISPMPVVDLGPDKEICEGESIGLIWGQQFQNYLWSTGSNEESINVYTSGLYWLEVTDFNGCSAKDEIDVEVLQTPHVDLGEDLYIYEDENIILDAGNPGAVFEWSTGDTSQTIEAYGDLEGIEFWVEATYGTCMDSDSITVTEYPLCVAEVPTAFSPNEDGVNDKLFVYGSGFKSLTFQVYNRVGDLVFETDITNEGWDGKTYEKKQEMDVFVYYLKAECLDGTITEKTGNITLIR